MKNTIKFSFSQLEFKKDLWLSKKELFDTFFGGFYDFILKSNGSKDLENNNIHSKEEFLDFAADWNAGGKDSCYQIGFGFHKYYVTDKMSEKIEDQPTTTYLGYLYHNGIMTDFLNFLVSFFAYWRNDEGCTSFNPYNYCDNMFVSGWAALVDTAKLFYFTSETVYWWQSFRVKYTLDHIPGVILSEYCPYIEYEGEYTLPQLRVAGYQFLGWTLDKEGKSEFIKTVANKDIEVYAQLKRTDIYNYWEREEKKIIKVLDPNWKRVDPA